MGWFNFTTGVSAMLPDYGLSFEGVVTTYTDTTHFKASSLLGKGTGFFKPTAGAAYEIFVVQADGAAPEGEQTPVVAYTSSDGTFQHAAFTVPLAVGDIVLIIHPLIASLGTKATAEASGAVTTTDYLMAYIKQQITLQIAADIIAGNIVNDITAAVDEPPTAKSLHDILHKDGNYTYDNTTDALEALSDEIHRLHQHVFILFIIPEAVASINADNVIIQTELAKLGHLHTITQADALDFPAFGMYSLAVCGTNSGTAWTTTNLADLKTVIGIPILTVDKVAGAYFEIGTDGGDAATKTTIDAISEIEGTVMGIGETSHETVTGLAAGLNTVSSSATYHTLDMSNANITEKVYACADNDPDLSTSNEDVVIGLIPQVLEDGTIGTDEDGVDVAAALGFLGFCYDASTLTTLGKGTLYLFAHMMIMTKILAPLETPNAAVVDLRKRLLGNMKNSFTNTAPLVEYIAGQNSVGTKLPVGKSLYDLIGNPTGETLTTLTAKWGNIARTLDLLLGARWDSSGDLGTDIAQLLTYTDLIDDGTNGLSAIKAEVEGLAGSAMIGTNNAATEAKQDIIDTNVDQIEVLVDSKVMGRLQVATTTWDLLRAGAGAGTDILFTGNTQAVILESLIVRMPTTADVTDGDPITSLAIATDDAEPGVIIAAADAPVASMTPESQFGWVGTLYIPVDTEIEGTIAGGDADAECLAIVTATYRAVVSGGYLS